MVEGTATAKPLQAARAWQAWGTVRQLLTCDWTRPSAWGRVGGKCRGGGGGQGQGMGGFEGYIDEILAFVLT